MNRIEKIKNKTPLERTYDSLRKIKGYKLSEDEYALKGKRTYYIKEKIKETGGIWDPKNKYWIVDSIKKALSFNALFRIKVRVEAHCHEKERVIVATHEEVISGVNRMGCGLCDTSFRSGDDVKIIEILDKELYNEIVNALKKMDE